MYNDSYDTVYYGKSRILTYFQKSINHVAEPSTYIPSGVIANPTIIARSPIASCLINCPFLLNSCILYAALPISQTTYSPDVGISATLRGYHGCLSLPPLEKYTKSMQLVVLNNHNIIMHRLSK